MHEKLWIVVRKNDYSILYLKVGVCFMEQINFLQYIEFEKRYSPHTLIAYKNDLSEFYDYLSTGYQLKTIQDVTFQIIRSWMASLMAHSTSSRSINRKITTLKSYYKFLLREGVLEQNPMLKIQSPKISKNLPVFIEKDKMDVLLDQIAFGGSFVGIRDRLILELFYATGIRRAELIGLKPQDVDLYNCEIKVLGKRNKERIIPFTLQVKKLIVEYIESKEKEQFQKTDEKFFLTEKGEALYPKLVYRIVKKYLSLVTTVKKKSPHVLRHTFATHMLNNGADINAIKELLGHANLAATQIYTHNTIERLQNIHKQAHPRA